MTHLALALSVLLPLTAASAIAQEPGAGPASDEPTAASVRALVDSGRYGDAEAAARRLLDRLAADSNTESLATAEAQNLLVEALRRGPRSTEAETLALAKRAVEVWEKLVGAEDVRLTVSLANLALLLVARNELAPAVALQQRVLGIRETAYGPEHPSVAQTLNNLANLKREAGDFAAAQQYFQRALSIRERVLGPEHADVAKTLNDSANNQFELGNFAEAQALYERSVAVFERSLGPDHPLVAVVLGNLGAVLRVRGDYGGAERVLRHALARCERTLGPDHSKTISVVTKLANVLCDEGDYAQAKQLYERSLASEERRLGPDHPDVAISLLDLGTLLATLEDYDGAELALARALAIREKSLPPDHPKRASAMQALADLRLDTGAPVEQIEPLLVQALAIEERSLGPDHPNVAATLASLVRLARRTGDAARAQQALDRAAAILERSFGSEHPALMKLLVEMSRTLEFSPTPERARPLIEHALAIGQHAFGAGSAEVGQTQAALASYLARSGDRHAALGTALAAEEAARQHVRLTVRALGERQALLYARTRATALDLALGLLAEDPAGTGVWREKVLNSLVQSRALVLDEMALRRRIVASTEDAETTRLSRELTAARERLARVVVRGPEAETPDRYQLLLDQTRREKEHAEEALAARSLVFRNQESRAAIGLRDVEQAMPRNTALVAFVRYARSRSALDAQVRETDEAAYAAFVLRPGHVPDLIPLGTAADVEAAIERWRQAIEWEARAPGVAPRRSLSRYIEAAAALRRKVWDTIAPLVTGSDTVFIVPDGALHLVSFAALPTEDGRFLLETGPLLHVLSAERDLVGSHQEAVGKGLLMMGAPAFASSPAHAAAHAFRGATASCASFRQLHFSALPGTRREIEAIGALWREHSRATAGASPSFVFEGPTADEAAFKDKAPGRQVLHLATHGFVLGGACAAPGGNALLCSGLALAGANRRRAASATAEDGILTAEEIAALDLGGVEWAVLSACETGLGEIAAGEGVFGLRRAFQVAGARSVIMSLWPADDRSTRTWMERLYRRRLQDHLSTAAAVRAASLDVLHQRRASGESPHPLYWAGFLAAGEWR